MASCLARLHRDYCSLPELVFTLFQSFQTALCLMSDPELSQKDDSAVGHLGRNRQLAEVLVQSHQDAPLDMSYPENLPISRILRPVSHPVDIVTMFQDLVVRGGWYTLIEKESHAPAS